MVAEDVAERGVYEVRTGVVAHYARAAFGVRQHRYAVAYAERFFCGYPMRDESCDRIVSATHFREDLRFGAVVERSGIRHLAAGLGVNRGAVQHHLAVLAGL